MIGPTKTIISNTRDNINLRHLIVKYSVISSAREPVKRACLVSTCAMRNAAPPSPHPTSRTSSSGCSLSLLTTSCSSHATSPMQYTLRRENEQVIAPGAARRYASRRWQFYVRPRTGPQSAHLWRPTSCRQPACR